MQQGRDRDGRPEQRRERQRDAEAPAGRETSNYIAYNLSRPNTLVDGGPNTCPALPGTEWNATNTVSATSLFVTTGGPKPIPICISVPAAQYPQAGTYTDIVTATLTVT